MKSSSDARNGTLVAVTPGAGYDASSCSLFAAGGPDSAVGRRNETVSDAATERHGLTPASGGPAGFDDTDPAEARDAVRFGLWMSGARCLLVYVAAPAVAGFGGLLHGLGLIVQVLGAVVSISGARRLWRLKHRGRHLYAALAVVVTLSTLLAVRAALL